MKPIRLLTLVLMMELAIYNLLASEPKVDQDHLYMEPDCGKIPISAKSRIANAGPSKKLYPWYIKVRRIDVLGKVFESCGGAIITRK